MTLLCGCLSACPDLILDVYKRQNLLREGLDIPEVSLVAILDADKEGFLRSETSLIQTIGRAARNADGKVIMYADTITNSMKYAIDETNRRRKLQIEYNQKHGITPKTIIKQVHEVIEATTELGKSDSAAKAKPVSYTHLYQFPPPYSPSLQEVW